MIIWLFSVVWWLIYNISVFINVSHHIFQTVAFFPLRFSLLYFFLLVLFIFKALKFFLSFLKALTGFSHNTHFGEKNMCIQERDLNQQVPFRII